ncbi:hypothetical protein Tco_1334212, partial [Tanacetum coccineum]
SWINHVEDSSSTSRWVFLLGGGAISWVSKKQTCITGSIIKSEFVALAAADKEAKWLRNLIYEILIWPKPITSIFIRNGVITIEFAWTQRNLADHLMKGLAKDLLEIGTQILSSRGARSKGTTYVNMKFFRFKKLGLSFLYVHQ